MMLKLKNCLSSNIKRMILLKMKNNHHPISHLVFNHVNLLNSIKKCILKIKINNINQNLNK